MLAVADLDNSAVHLETAVESNLAFYARFGFEVIRTLDVPGGPRIWELWREPEAA